MTGRNVIRLASAVLGLLGLVLLISTGWIAAALGAVGAGAPGAVDSASMAFWFQLAFMRLFGTAIIGLGAILWWCLSHLTSDQQSSLLKVLSVALAFLALVTVVQQVAIWDSAAGWALAGTLLILATACASSMMRGAPSHAV